MALRVPRAADEPLSAGLEQFFRQTNVDWARERRTDISPPALCLSPQERRQREANARKRGQPALQLTFPDRWLAGVYPQLLLDFAGDVGLRPDQLVPLRHAIAEATLTSAEIAPKTAVLRPSLRENQPPNPVILAPQQVPSLAGAVTRRNATSYILDYLTPLFPAHAYAAWLDELGHSQVSWRGPRPSSPAVPRVVAVREARHDAQLVMQWVGAPPTPPEAGTSPAEQRRYQRELLDFHRRRARVQAFVQSEPTAPAVTPTAPLTEREAATLDREQASAAGHSFPIVVLPTGVSRSANLFVSEVALVAAAYLDLLAVPLRLADPGGILTQALLGIAYGAIALALTPINCLYDNYHGTAAIQQLLPRLNASAVALKGYGAQRLGQVVEPLLPDARDPAAHRLLDAFSRLTSRIADGVNNAHRQLGELAAEQGGGRVYAPQGFAREWSFTIAKSTDQDETETLTLTTPELFSFDIPDPEREIFWFLPSLWTPLATAAALVNQAGMRFWLNAANNRWGGRHPPHDSHRQGRSIDADVGLSWSTEPKVPDVKLRDRNNLPLSNRDVPDNASRPTCLTGMDRVAGWVLVQAFVLVGISSYLYGDKGIVVEAAQHLDRLNARHPLPMGGKTDTKSHYNHWHFEMLVGPRTAGPDPYEWAVPDKDLLDTLYGWAMERDQDPSFWAKMAGLDKPPKEQKDFDAISDAEQRHDWLAWWNWRDTCAGIPLLPVWSPGQSDNTLGPDVCMDANDMPVPPPTDDAALG